MSTLLDALPFPCLAISGEGRIVSANHLAESLLGKGLNGNPFVLWIRQPKLADAVRKVLADKSPQVVAAEDGSQYKVHVLPRSEGGAVVTWEDVSEADELGRMRRDFVANVSHELRSPLTSLMGFIETLQASAGQDPALRERFLAIMAREAARMNRLIGDLLSLSTVEANERVRPRLNVDLADVCRAVVQRLAPQAQSRLQIDYGELPNVPGDGDQLGQALANLIENALRYGKLNTPVKVTMTLVEDPILMGQAVAIMVSDQGDGIAAHHIPRLTERFYRIDTHRSQELGGTGLGLAIVKHIVNRHRGRLKIESQPGQGSRFTILLPLS